MAWLILILLGLFSHGLANISGTIYGYNPLNKETIPLGGVEIEWEGSDGSISSRRDGKFDITSFKEDGIYFINFSKKGYEKKTITTVIDPKVNKKVSIKLLKRKGLRTASKKRVEIKTGQVEGLSSLKATIELSIVMDEMGWRGRRLLPFPYMGAGIRGIGDGQLYPVTIYVDGVGGFDAGTSPLAYSLDSKIDSITYFSGFQGSWLGRGLNDVIDIKTELPVSAFSIDGVINLGSGVKGESNLKLGNQNYFFAMNFPIVKKKFLVKVGGDYYRRDGVFHNPVLNKNIGGERGYGVFLRGDVFTSGLDLYFSTKYRDDDSSRFSYRENLSANLVDSYEVFHNRDNFEKKKIVDSVVHFEIPFEYSTWSSSFTYQYKNKKEVLDLDFTSLTNANFNFSEGADSIRHLVTVENRMTSSELSEEYFVWSVGKYLYYQKQKFNHAFFSGVEGTVQNELDFTDSQLGVALFGNINFPLLFLFSKSVLSQALNLIVGIRGELEYNQSSLINSLGTENKVKGTEGVGFTVLPKISLQYAPIEQVLFYLTGARGYRSRGINSYTSNLDRVYYLPEYSWQLDLGVNNRFTINKQTALVNFSFYYTYWQDQQVLIPIRSDVSGNNIGEFGVGNSKSSEEWGLKFQSRFPLYFGFSIGGDYGFSVSKYLDFKIENPNSSGAVITADGNRQAFSPYHRMSAFISHQISFEWLSIHDRLVNRLGVEYISDHYIEAENKNLQAGYPTLNYGLEVGIAGFDFTFWVKNALDKHYILSAIPSADGNSRVRLGDSISMGGQISVGF